MKRFALILGGLLMVGCAQENKQAGTTNESGQPTPTAPATPSVATRAAPATPAAPAEPTVVAPAPVAPSTPTVVAPVTPAPIAPAEPSVVAPAIPAPAPVAKPSPIFEMTQDNKIYVFASVQAMTDFSAGKVQPTVVEKPNFTPAGRTLVLEAADATEADAIFASYNKLHPVAK